jgi:hypothetical protein
MSIGWVAGAVRGKALARRSLGAQATHSVAAQPSLPAALQVLSESTYGHRLGPDMDLEAAQHAVAETTLWHLRVLAGWLPPRGAGIVRALAAWFEASDLAELAVAISAGRIRPAASFALGTLGTLGPAWARAAEARSLQELRAVLAHSAWGDPGGSSLQDIFLGLRLGWARILGSAFREHPAWGAGELALAAAAALFLRTGESDKPDPKRVPELGPRWDRAPDVAAFVARLPTDARWPFREVDAPGALWKAQRAWWIRVEGDAAALVSRRALGRATVVGASVALVVDCWRVRAALARAYRGAPDSEEPSGQG